MIDILNSLAGGLVEAMQPLNFGMIVLGCVLGLLVGALPGLSIDWEAVFPPEV